MYRFCKFCKNIIDSCPLFRPIFSPINTLIYNLAKFLVPVLKSLSSNQSTVKDSSAFAVEIVEQDFVFFIGSLDVDSLFINIPLQETIDICANTHSENTEKVEVYQKQNLGNFYIMVLKNPILFLIESSISKSIESLLVHLQICHWLMLFLYTLKRIGCKTIHLTLSLINTSGMLMIFLCSVYFTRTFRRIQKFSKRST